MTYYRLRCQTCRINFEPVFCTQPNELLRPDYEAVRESAGESNANRLEEFHKAHAGHALLETDPDNHPTHFSTQTAPTGSPKQKGVS